MVTQKKWTVDELLALSKAGLLDQSKRIELLKGEIFEIPPTGEGHASIVDILNRKLVVAFLDKAIVRNQNPVVLGLEDLPLPDFALLHPREDFYRQSHPTPQDIFWLIEVSDSTLAYDRGNKLERYAAASILEVWIVNLNAGYTEVYRDPLDGQYLSKFVVQNGAEVAPLAFPDTPVKPL